MPTDQQLLIGGFGVVVILVALRLFRAPIRWVFKLLLNTLFGFVGLLLFNFVSEWLSLPFNLGFNWINAAVIGVLGLPGFALLLLLQWLYAI